MKRIKTLLIGISLGVAYAFCAMLIVQFSQKTISVGYIFTLPLVLGVIPVLLSTKAQLGNYLTYIIAPWISVLTFSFLSLISGFEGLICLVIIIGPFLVLGSLGAYGSRLIKLKYDGDNSKKLYLSLVLPFVVLVVESFSIPQDHYGNVATTIIVESDKLTVWENIKNIRSIKESEIMPHFIHLIGIPKPVNGELDIEGVGATRSITWQKGLKFKEVVTRWDEGVGFEYDIIVNPDDIPPNTLDEHVIIGGQYFDAVSGSYSIRELDESTQEVTLSSTYRITSTVNFYGKYWTDFIFDDFHKTILEVVKSRSESIDRPVSSE